MGAESESRAKTDREAICRVPLVTDLSWEQLNERQRVNYREHRRKLLKWLHDLGKSPDKGEGYAEDTIYNRGYRLDVFYRWEQEGSYPTAITTDYAILSETGI